MLRFTFLCLVFFCLPDSLSAAHGATGEWLKGVEKVRGEFASKIDDADIQHRWSDDGKTLFTRLWDGKGGSQWFANDLVTGQKSLLEREPAGKASVEQFPQVPVDYHRTARSPDGKWTVSFVDGLPLLTPVDGESISSEYRLPEGRVWEKIFLWAPDSSAVVIMGNTTFPPRKVHYVRSSPEDKVQPEHFTNVYPKAGDSLNIPLPVVFFTDGSQPLPLEEELAEDPFEIRKLRWHTDSKSLTFEYIERGFGKYRLIEMKPRERTQRVLLAEESEKFVYVYGNTYCHHLANGQELIWMSQRTGRNHLYLVSRQSGKTVRPLTSGDFIVRDVVRVDEDSRNLVLSVSGLHPGQDPYFIHFIRVDMDTGKMTVLTDADGTHKLYFSPDGNYYLGVWSRVGHPRVYEIRRSSDGGKIATLPVPEVDALLASGWQMPEPFVVKDRNDKFDIHGVIFRPRNFDTSKSYPVIENIYAGPHGSFVPKSWQNWYGQNSELTESGFIVVQIDGLGTNDRGREFHEYAYKNLIDAGLPDRIKWLKAAAAKYPQFDLDRVGIFGGSAGGQSALAALLTHPEFYKAGVADCGCHDNRMDKIWWSEQWMDCPVDDSYEQNSNLTHISKLEGALMLTVGELDTNVDPSSTYQVVDALIKADKDFEYYMVPGADHGIGGSPYLRKKRIEFFQKHLQNP